jgi:hypothetical protein
MTVLIFKNFSLKQHLPKKIVWGWENLGAEVLADLSKKGRKGAELFWA